MFDVRSSAGKAGFLPGADEALRIFRGADGGAQVHDCRGIICRAGVAGEGGGFFGNQGFDFFKGLCQAIQAADDADDIAVDDGFRPVKGQGQKAGNSIRADTLEAENVGAVVGKTAVEFADNDLGGGMQRAGAGVISQSLPIAVNFFFIGRGQTFDSGKTMHEFFKIAEHGFDRGLLQHKFGDQYGVRIGVGTALDPPGKIASVGVVPV